MELLLAIIILLFSGCWEDQEQERAEKREKLAETRKGMVLQGLTPLPTQNFYPSARQGTRLPVASAAAFATQIPCTGAIDTTNAESNYAADWAPQGAAWTVRVCAEPDRELWRVAYTPDLEPAYLISHVTHQSSYERCPI